MSRNITEIIFLLDRSGSMAGLERDTINGFNSFVEKQTNSDGNTLVTAVLFDDEYELLWDGIASHAVRLTERQYYVRGSTALLDSVGKTILEVGNRLSKTKEEDRPNKVIFVITTDGMENASREFTYDKVRELITHQREKYSWDFIFLGANMDAVLEASNIGVEVDNAFSFEATETGLENMYMKVCEVVSEKRQK
ncbi:VWA domain-containing protein [Evansella sp. AB-rgal1]|uniref:vWA domain-containing protein n=1 Tax=Evansella sp. AB-rgal1 TaxID=3242696 RepID=UPI00359E59E8